MVLLEPPGITPDDPPVKYEPFDLVNKKYYTDPDEILQRNKDPDWHAAVVTYLEQKVFDNGTEIADIKSTLKDLKLQVNRVASHLKSIKPKDKPYMAEDAPLNIVDRFEWGALNKKSGMKPLQHPIMKVNFTFNTSSDSCDDPESCVKLVKQIQLHDMKKGLHDIANNFLVAEDGNVYEGRGWHLCPAIADTGPKFENSLDVAFAGNFESDTYPIELFEIAIKLVKSGVEKNYVSKDYKLL